MVWHVDATSDDLSEIQVSVEDVWLLIKLAQLHPPRVCHHRVPPRDVVRRLVSRRRDERHERLCVHGAGPGQQLPVRGPCHHVEGSGEHKHVASQIPVDPAQLREANVVADPDADSDGRPAMLSKIDDGRVIACGERVRLLERDLSWNVDVEEMNLLVQRNHVPVLVEGVTAVVELVVNALLREGSADQKNLVFSGCSGEHLCRLRLSFNDVLRIFWEVLDAIWRVHALRQHDKLGTIRCCSSDLCRGVLKIVILVRTN
mmetsp:Transcript_26850/g.54709  ORF Transcript_26850/g.54709 Transcript_26850/m.54709 type:complete len:259 (-) Transcript_26850:272-1048(-)